MGIFVVVSHVACKNHAKIKKSDGIYGYFVIIY